MPYIVTTSQPRPKHLIPEAVLVAFDVVYRRAVATLEEARTALRDADEDGWVEDRLFALAQRVMADDPQLSWDRDRGLIYDRARDRLLPESGGTVGPLPDGTVIEVERETWINIMDEVGGGWPQIPESSDDPLATEILDTFNAREAAAR
jgi:hypothetical protein